jgi:hypothetical protein
MQGSSRIPFISTEGAIGLAVAFYLGLADMTWDQRALGVLVTGLLILDIARRVNRGFLIKSAIFLGGNGLLLSGTWRRIWEGFHESFPDVTERTVLFRIIIVVSTAACCTAAYTFLIRPWGKEGYRVLPAQVIAFGASVIGIGFLTLVIGLIWQFRQNLIAGTAPTGAPTFTVVQPRITQQASPPALPAPEQARQSPLFSGYNLSEAGVTALANELYKIRDVVSKRIELDHMSTDPGSGGLVNNLYRACDQAGVDCPIINIHPNSPRERGIMIYVSDPDNAPGPAKAVQAALLTVGLKVPFVARPGFGPDAFTLFVGPPP